MVLVFFCGDGGKRLVRRLLAMPVRRRAPAGYRRGFRRHRKGLPGDGGAGGVRRRRVQDPRVQQGEVTVQACPLVAAGSVTV